MKNSLLFAVVSALCAMTFLGVSCGSGPTAAKTPIAITGLAAGIKVAAGDTLLITWTQSVASPKVSYNYNFPGGAGWQEFTTVIPVNNNSVKAVLPVTSYSDSFQIKVEDNGGTYGPGTSAKFSIQYIVITYPTAGATLTNGSTVMITWKDTPTKISSLRLLLSTDGGMSFGDMLTASVSPNTTSSTWMIGGETGSGAPFTFPSANCILKIKDYTNDQLVDVTGTFSVQ
jgi:hypothetical protein